MGICGSKESSGDSGAAHPAARQANHGKNRRPGVEPLSQKREGNQKQAQNQNSSNVNSTGSKGDSALNISKAEKAGSIPSQTPTAHARAVNNDEKTGASTKDKEVKVLLLGAGESGKSTIIQQLKILHQNGFTHEELLEYRSVVYRNILDIGRDLLQARKKFQIELEEDSGVTQEDIDKIYWYDEAKESSDGSEPESEVNDEKAKELNNTPTLAALTRFPADISATFSKIWNLSSTKDLLNGPLRSKFYLMDSAQYFMENLPRISEPDYLPSEQDILRSRQKTSGIFDSVFDVGSNLKLHIYDVGGQRSERKKWIHCFDNVTLIIFCVSLSEYNQLLLEDQSQNRFQESLVLFDNVINSRWFARTSVVLFLNKIDLFAEKLQKVPLETYFPDYTGGKDINKAAKYILWRFIQLNRANLSIYPHVTQATDTSNIKLVFAAIKETLLENTLKDTSVL